MRCANVNTRKKTTMKTMNYAPTSPQALKREFRAVKFPRNWISWLASVLVVSMTALSGVSRADDPNLITNPLNLLASKTVAGQHFWYAANGAGMGCLVDNRADTWAMFSGPPADNYAPDTDLRVSVSGFDSAVGTVRYWGDPYANPSGNRALNGVTVYSSTTSTTSLNTADYTLRGDFSFPLGTPAPAGWTLVPGAAASYFDVAISAPAGTKSLLLKFKNAGIAGNFANLFQEIQAFPPPPAPPVVAITSPLESASVPAAGFAIDATATDEGSITSVTFFIDDVQIGDPDTSPPYSIVMVGATPGARVLTAKAIDNDLNEVTSTAVNITVTATNQAPVATLTSPLDAASYVQGMSIPLAATATDDGGVASVTFYYNGGSGDVQIGDPVTTAPYTSTWTGATTGSYTVTAVARDFENVPSALTEASSASITVTANQAPVVTLTSPLDAASYVEGMGIPLAATATDDLGVAGVTFFYNDGGADVSIGAGVLTAPDTYTLTWTGATLGSHTVKAVALDVGDPGLPSAPSSAIITVTANQAPLVTLTSPLNEASYVEGVDIPLAATATDDVGVASVTFYDGETPIGPGVLTAPDTYTLTWNTATQGAHTVKAVALDTGGLPSAPSSASITVTANEPPFNVVITSPVADSTQAQNFPFTISATAQVTYGSITKVEFYDGATLLGTDTTDPFSCAATVTVTGDHALTAKAFGSGGLFTVSAPVYVKVAPNLLENKTVACQHYYYGMDGQGGLVNNNPSVWNFFSSVPDNWTPDNDLRVSVSGFNSDVGKVRYWGGTSYGPNCRSLNGVTIYSSATATTSLDPADYTSCGTFPIPLNDGSTLPAGWVQDSAGLCYYDIAISAPAGTQSLLLMFTNAGISGNIANNIQKIQAFAPPPAPLVAITNPAEGKFVDDLSFTITADATVPTGHIAKVEFYDNNVLVGTDETLPYTCTITGATLGAHVLVAKAMDNNSAWIVSTPVNVTNATNLLGGKPIACNAPFNDGGIWRMNNNVADFCLFGVNNYDWYIDNQIAITGFDSNISIIRVWCSPFSNNGREIHGFTFKSSTTDLTAGDRLNPANYETDLGDHPLPLVTSPAPPAAGWTAVPVGNYYDIAVSVPSGTKSLLIHAYGPSPYCPNLPEIQAFASSAPPVVPGYDAWAGPDGYNLTGADADRNADPDGDRFTNIQEFLFGTSPIAGNGTLASSETASGNLVLHWLQRETGAAYLLKESTTMAADDWSTSAVVPVLDDQTGAPADYDRYKATIPINAARKFFRVEGTEN
jgi:hypothetical protein